MNRRHGALTALGGTAPALAVGDVQIRHLRFTPAGVAWHRGETRLLFVPWADVEAIAIDPPKTRWPHPSARDWTMSFLAVALGGAGEPSEPEPYFARMTQRDGDEELWEVDRHYISGYRRRDAHAASRLVEYVSTSPTSRALLAQPDEILDRISVILRSTQR